MSWKPHVEREATMRMMKHDLLRWTCERHATDCPLDRRLLRDKALELADEHGLTGFKCSKKWLTYFLKKHGFSADLKNSSGPIFSNYRLWIDMMRSVITRYKYKDLFHLDELTMYTDVSPSRISSALRRTSQRSEPDANLKRATILMCCNASGTEKLPLLICGSYPAVITDKDHVYRPCENASISDQLFREWLSRLDEHMLRSDRKILLLLHRDRRSALRGLDLSNVRHVFFPDDFPPLLRPLKRDVFHFVKMMYRSEYVEGIGERSSRWNVEDVVRCLVEAWRRVPRDLIIASFQRTSFRTDDCFLDIHCDAWNDLETGVSFRRFVTFDDELATEQLETPGHSYDLRTKEIVRLVDDRFDDRSEIPIDVVIHDRPRENENLTGIDGKATVERERKSSLKRSSEDARLDEDCYEETSNASSNDDSIIILSQMSRTNEGTVVAPPSEKLPKIIGVETVNVAIRQEVAARIARSEKVESMTNATSNKSRVTTDRVYELETADDDQEKSESSGRAASSVRSMEDFPAEVDDADDVASQPAVLDDAFAIDADNARMPITEAVSVATSRNESVPAGSETKAEGNDGHKSRKWTLKRKRLCDDVEEPRRNSTEFDVQPDDGEPKRKRSRPDSDNWSKKYETTFVFGSSDVDGRNIPVVSFDAADDEGTLLNEVRRPRPRRSCETEKSIFTIRPRND